MPNAAELTDGAIRIQLDDSEYRCEEIDGLPKSDPPVTTLVSVRVLFESIMCQHIFRTFVDAHSIDRI